MERETTKEITLKLKKYLKDFSKAGIYDMKNGYSLDFHYGKADSSFDFELKLLDIKDLMTKEKEFKWMGKKDIKVENIFFQNSGVVIAYKEENGEKIPVGYCRGIGDGFKTFYIEDMMLLPEHRGKGIADYSLILLIQLVFNETGISWIGVNSNQAAENFYKRIGFDKDSDPFLFLTK